MSDPGAISVVIPTFCAEPFLEQVLSSVLQQTRLPAEIVIVDDVSNDRTAELARCVAERSSVPIRVERLGNNTGGPSGPINTGIAQARGDYIALLDHDDLMLPEKLDLQWKVLDANLGLDFVISDYEHFDANGTLPRSDARSWEPEGHGLLIKDDGPELQIVGVKDSLEAFLRRPGLALSCSGYFFRKGLWERVGGFRHEYMPVADYDFLLRALDKPIAWIDKILFRKRVHDRNHWRTYVASGAGKWQSERSIARAQRAMLTRTRANRAIKDLVAGHTAYVATGFAAEGKTGSALAEALHLLRLGKPANAMRVFAAIARISVGRLGAQGARA
jgi:glycosyltransferase involved in cell wall biosynthesis